MAPFDIFMIVLVVLTGIKGYQRGFVVEVFSLLAFFIGLLVALKLSFPLALRFFGHLESFWLVAVVIFIVLFFLVIWVAKLFANWLKSLIDFTPVGILDNFLGVLLSVLKWSFIISVTIWVLNSADLHLPTGWIEYSSLYGVVESIAPIIVENVNALFPWFQDVLDSMDDEPIRV